MQCPICLRYYCERRVHPGGHVCHPVKIPDIPKNIEPKPKSPEPKSPEPKSPEPDPMPPREPTPEPMITHADVVRFMARERMNRHERKRDRWHQQMFG